MSQPMRPDDPAYWMLEDPSIFSTPTPGVHDEHCFICRDPEFAQMGLPLCRPCPECTRMSMGLQLGHIAADDNVCYVCGYDEQDAMEVWYEVIQHYRHATRVLWNVEFLHDDPMGAWHQGDRGVDHGLESDLVGAPDIRVIRTAWGETLTLHDPYNGVIRRLD